MLLLKNKLREKGLDPRNMFLYEFRNLSIEHEKKFREAREEARRRIQELADLFPNAFNVASRQRWVDDFLFQMGVKKSVHISH